MELEELQVSKNIREGLLSFQDYSVSKWFHHMETLIEKYEPPLSEEVGRDAQQNLFEALDEFTMFYQEGLRLEDIDAENWRRDAAEDCEAHEILPLFEHLRDIWAYTLDIKDRDKIGIPELLEAVKRNRKAVEAVEAMEAVEAEKIDLSTLEVYYDRNYFKCT
ncbi:hypothetical protein VP1G_10978 [Cytospora mali]|uniref:Uncharacterized protein n=1 Tax=Cytospora mali TaxID=578113 RepID=A0A194V1L9_CYTMA|nr:hypothetical protein VP1G_10978 [Valsa mali var. pyri (nom. inval.)]